MQPDRSGVLHNAQRARPDTTTQALTATSALWLRRVPEVGIAYGVNPRRMPKLHALVTHRILFASSNDPG